MRDFMNICIQLFIFADNSNSAMKHSRTFNIHVLSEFLWNTKESVMNIGKWWQGTAKLYSKHNRASIHPFANQNRQNIVFHEIFPRGDALKNIAFSDTMFKIRMSFMNIDDGQFIHRPFVLSPVELDRWRHRFVAQSNKQIWRHHALINGLKR